VRCDGHRQGRYCNWQAVGNSPDAPEPAKALGQILAHACSELPKVAGCLSSTWQGLARSRLAPSLPYAAVMMNRRSRVALFLMACAASLAWSSLSLAAQPEPVMACCGGMGDCGGSLKCCDPALLGVTPCSEENPGYCQEACPRAVLD
jgi:hypothetical protein